MERFGEDVVVPIFGIFCAFGLPMLAFVAFRIMRHRERMEMIRMGLMPAGKHAQAARPATPRYPNGPPVVPAGDDAQVILRKGISLTFIGFAITLGLSFIGLHDTEYGMSWHPGPWLLGGLIPLFIGLAQVATAVLSGATLRPPQSGGSSAGAPPPPYRDANDLPNYDAPYTYRPGGTQELRPPER